MYNYGYYSNSGSNPLDSMFGGYGDAIAMSIITVVCFILAIIGGVLLLALFLAKRNEGKFTGFAGWLYNFFNFKSMFAELLLKGLYLISAIFVTLEYLGLLLFTEGGSIGGKIFSCFLGIIVSNVVLRLLYEFILVIFVICRNTTEINRKLSGATMAAKTEVSQPVMDDGVVFCRNCGNKFSSAQANCPSCGHPRY